MQKAPCRSSHCQPCRLWSLVAGLFLTAAAHAQLATPVLTLPVEGGQPGQRVGVWLNFLNASATHAVCSFPSKLEARLLADGRTLLTTLELRIPSEAGTVSLAPGAFTRREYTLVLPETLSGTVLLEVAQLHTPRIALDVRKPDPLAAPVAKDADKSALVKILQESGSTPKKPYDPGQFFKEHFFGYEPFYFIAGKESPNAKFQISLRYQVLNSDGLLAQKVPVLKGLNVAYTQTSLWDWNVPSAPFLDTSYKPELLYLWQRVDRGRWANWFRLDLQSGLQHESNGKGGSDSRSLNIAYLRTTAVFGPDNGFQLTLSPRVWCYVGDLNDNPSLRDYRGYADLRAVAGWQRGLQLSAYGRLGDDGNRGSLQLDLTYPMMRLLSGSFSVYLQVQYFTGYGESLLYYNQRSDAWRAGFAIYR